MSKLIFNNDFFHTAINHLWRLISGPVLLVLIPLYLTSEAQGYWYTFISLAALAVFADMGFSTILLQFSAHEFAHLSSLPDKTLSGNSIHLDRLASLFRFSMKWSTTTSLIAFPFILLTGLILLNQEKTNIHWVIPWIIYGVGSIFVFINSILLSFIEGCNNVGEVQKIRFFISLITIFFTIFFLIVDLNLYALAISLCIGGLSGTILVINKFGQMLKQLYFLQPETSTNWKHELQPLIIKYALSWSSGYFIFYFFTPMAFHYYGPTDAGKIGLSIAIFSAVFGISNIWMIIITPKLNILVSQKKYSSLNSIFKKHLLLTLLSYCLGAGGFFLLLYFVDNSFFLADRLVSPYSLAVLSSAWFMQTIINGIALYIRAHKEEPFMIPSLVSSVYIVLTTWITAMHFPAEFLFIPFLSSYFFGLPWVIILYKKYNQRHTFI